MTVAAKVRNTPEAWTERASEPESWRAAGWSERGQTQRFLAAVGHLNLRPGESLLDFGCGTGRLSEWVPAGVEYVGYDWSPGMVLAASAAHPEAGFTCVPPVRRFDAVAAVGPFNLRDNWSKEKTWNVLSDLWAGRVGGVLVVSLYRGTDTSCIRYAAGELVGFCEWVGCADFVIDAGYLPNDLMLVMRR